MSSKRTTSSSVLLTMQMFIAELQRRKVVRVALVYAAFAWLVVQFSDIISAAFAAPDWVMRVLVLFLILALPATLILAWLFEITPTGIHLTADTNDEDPESLATVMLLGNGTNSDHQNANALCDHLSRKLTSVISRYGGKISGLHNGYCIIEFTDSSSAVSCGLKILTLLKNSMRPASLSVASGSFSHSTNTLSGQAVSIAESINYPELNKQHLVLSMTVYERELTVKSNPLVDYCKNMTFSLNEHDLQAVQVEPAALDDPAVLWRLRDDSEDTTATTSRFGKNKSVLGFGLILLVGFSWLYLENDETGTGLIPSMAIMPFRTLDKSTESMALALGLNEELHDRVRQLNGLQLSSSRSARALAARGLAATALGEQLDVNYLLEGSARRIGEEYRIAIQLVETHAGNTVWSHIYQSKQDDMYSVQEDISSQLARIFAIKYEQNWQDIFLDKKDYGLYLEAIGYFGFPNNILQMDNSQAILEELLTRYVGYSPIEAALCKLHLIRFDNNKAIASLNQAISYCEKAEQSGDNNLSVLNALAQISLAKSDFEKASGYIKRGLAIDENNLDLLMTSALINTQTGQADKAEEILLEAISNEPWLWKLHDMLGIVYMNIGNLPESISSFKKAAELMPTDAGIFNKLGAAYFSMGSFTEAAVAFEKSLELQANNAAYTNIGTLYYFAGEFEKSREYNLKATELSPKNYLLWRNLGDSEMSIPGEESTAMSHYQLAAELAKEVLQVTPDNSEALSSLAWIMAQTGQHESAETYILKALKLTPNNANTLYDASGTYARIGKNTIATELIHAAINAGIPSTVIAATPGLRSLYQAIIRSTENSGEENE